MHEGECAVVRSNASASAHRTIALIVLLTMLLLLNVGEYKCDARHGFGTYKWGNGDKFSGEWVEGEQRGRGTYYYQSGDVFKGTWVDGKKSGRGCFTSPAATQTWLEVWENGMRIDRRPIRYFPTRLLRTTKESCDKKSEALRIRTEIDRLQSRLAIIQTQVSPHKPPSANESSGGSSSGTASAAVSVSGTTADAHLNSATSSSTTAASASAPAPAATSPLRVQVPESPVHNHNINSSVSSADEEERRQIDMMLDTGIDFDYAAMSSPRRTSPSHRSAHNSPHTHGTGAEEHHCKVCFEAQINTVLIRCGHMCVCKRCATSLDKCPICRQGIEEVIQCWRV